ncbi:MAG: hypothetical protein ABI419_08605 [Ginsengibacter sp.]
MIFSQTGLLLDILGVVLLFIYGLPSRIADQHEGDMLRVGPLQREQIEKKRKADKKINSYAYVGLALIGVGFIFQFIGTFL